MNPLPCKKDAFLEGTLYLVVSQQWKYRDVRGYELWELEKKGAQSGSAVLDVQELGEVVRGRKWVHDLSLMTLGQKEVRAPDLMDKNPALAVPELGEAGKRRFAPRLERRTRAFTDIRPGSFVFTCLSSCLCFVYNY